MANESETLFQQAVGKHRAGDVRGAAELYRHVLTQENANVDARYLLGTALLQLGEFAESIACLKDVVAARPDVADAHNNLGIACKADGDWEQAARSFQAALKINPEYVEALFNLGTVMQQRGLFADAAKCFRHALRLTPADNESRFSLAVALKSQGNWDEAETLFRGCREAGYDDPDLDVHLAFVLARQEKLDEAADVYRAILARRPEFAEIHSSLSYIDERRGRLGEALAAAQQAVELKPDYAEGHNNRGIALRSLHRLDDASAAFARALELRPDFALAEFNLGTTHLLAGDYARGWPGYERRAEALGEQPRSFPAPRWNGEAMPGRRLFIFADQGFGDTIQFARFLGIAKQRSEATIVLECQPRLLPLLETCAGTDEVVTDTGVAPPFEKWISLSSLPGVFGTTLPTIPTEVPYVFAPGPLRDELADVLNRLEGPRKIGLVWRGNPEQARDTVRSCPAETFARILDVDDVDFVSLQVGDGDSRGLAKNGARIAEAGSVLRDFADTAALISRLDLVITVDTATAHLAGALGVPVWTLLCHTPDWRWGLTGETCPWYPTMRLFRQPAWGDWDAVIGQVVASLRNS